MRMDQGVTQLNLLVRYPSSSQLSWLGGLNKSPATWRTPFRSVCVPLVCKIKENYRNTSDVELWGSSTWTLFWTASLGEHFCCYFCSRPSGWVNTLCVDPLAMLLALLWPAKLVAGFLEGKSTFSTRKRNGLVSCMTLLVYFQEPISATYSSSLCFTALALEGM
jgi:hypothetical protein